MKPAGPAAGPPRGGAGDRRAGIVDAAFRRLAQHGFEGLRLRDIAADVGLHHATLLHHLPDKQALVAALVEHVMARFAAADAAEAADVASPVARLRAHHRAIRARFAAEPEMFAVLNELSVRARRDPAIAAALDRSNAVWADHLRGLVRAAEAAGALRAGLPVEAIVTLELALFKGLSIRLGEAGALGATSAGGRGGAAAKARLEQVDEAIGALEALLGWREAQPAVASTR